MKILRVIKSVDPSGGGPIEALIQISLLNNKAGHLVEILSTDDPSSDLVKNFPIKCHAVGPVSSHYGYTPALNRWLEDSLHNYDCVIIEGLWQYNCWGAWRSLKKRRIPYFVFVHGMLAPWFKMKYPLKHIKKWLYWPWADYRVLKGAAAVLFTCEQERILAQKSFWLYQANEEVVEFGTYGIPEFEGDCSSFAEGAEQLGGYRNFLFLGRLHPVKGLDLILKGLAKIKKSGHWDEHSMRLIVAGPYDTLYGLEMRNLAKSLHLENSVLWLGGVSGYRKWNALRSAEVLVLPSHQENFGLVVAESLSAGVPVLISKAVNIWKEVISDGAGLAEDDSEDGFIRMMMRWLVLSRDEMDQMKINARNCFLNRFTVERAANSLISTLSAYVGKNE